MKEGFDKEIDSLLRRRIGAGAEARVLAGISAPRDEAHLDADELSAFAEGALPAAARVAAASHMADCDECRGLAVGLARASGAEAELERRAVAVAVPASESVAARSRGWWSSLFASRALRYAAPALALCLVAVVSFVALRSRWKEAGLSQPTAESRSPQLEVAKTQESSAPPDSTATANANASGTAQGTIGDVTRNASAANTAVQPPSASAKGASVVAGSPEVAEVRPADEPSPPPPAKAEESVDVAPPMTKAGPPVEVGESARVESKERSARQSQTEDETAYNDSSVQQQRRASNQVRGMDNVQMPDGSRGQKRGSVENAPSNSGGGGSLASVAPKSDRDRSQSAPKRGRSSEEERERSEDDETNRAQDSRSVAGHRFRRVGSAWVDVSYKSSMASTGVRRGTDAYRALVADIPEIGRIASQLGGEVIVVVKGRAYRIR